jgi:prepilin-type N-terminal cleavage/methylation domain-containing protein
VHSGRSGFTLIEVMVALAIGALVVLMAERLFAGAGDGGRVLAAARERLDRDANARRWLEATFLSLAVGDSGASGFTGNPDRVRFTAWQPTPGGWFEPRQIDLGLNEGRIAAGVSPGEPLILVDSVSDVVFDYLLEYGAETHWVTRWISPVSAPFAVRIRLVRERGVVDTLLYLIKERG